MNSEGIMSIKLPKANMDEPVYAEFSKEKTVNYESKNCNLDIKRVHAKVKEILVRIKKNMEVKRTNNLSDLIDDDIMMLISDIANLINYVRSSDELEKCIPSIQEDVSKLVDEDYINKWLLRLNTNDSTTLVDEINAFITDLLPTLLNKSKDGNYEFVDHMVQPLIEHLDEAPKEETEEEKILKRWKYATGAGWGMSALCSCCCLLITIVLVLLVVAIVAL